MDIFLFFSYLTPSKAFGVTSCTVFLQNLSFFGHWMVLNSAYLIHWVFYSWFIPGLFFSATAVHCCWSPEFWPSAIALQYTFPGSPSTLYIVLYTACLLMVPKPMSPPYILFREHLAVSASPLESQRHLGCIISKPEHFIPGKIQWGESWVL